MLIYVTWNLNMQKSVIYHSHEQDNTIQVTNNIFTTFKRMP